MWALALTVIAPVVFSMLIMLLCCRPKQVFFIHLGDCAGFYTTCKFSFLCHVCILILIFFSLPLLMLLSAYCSMDFEHEIIEPIIPLPVVTQLSLRISWRKTMLQNVSASEDLHQSINQSINQFFN